MVKSIYHIDNYEITHAIIDKTQTVKVIYIGQISGMKVYDLIYPLTRDNYYQYLKVIILEKEPNRYAPVFYNFIDIGRYSEPLLKTIKNSFIITDKHLVVSESFLSGTGGHVDGFYLYVPPDILQDKKAVPRRLDLDIISEILKNRLADGYNAPAGNAFNIKTLHFHSCVTTAAHCFAGDSTDTVDIQFKLDNGMLKLILFKYSKL